MRLAHSRTPKEAEGRRRRAQFPRKTTARRVWGAIGAILESTLESIKGADCLRTEKMFPSHLSVNDLGVFAVVMVLGLIVVLLFMFDFVSMKLYCLHQICVLRVPHVKNHCDQEKPRFHLSLSF